jgi:hypothetical protein
MSIDLFRVGTHRLCEEMALALQTWIEFCQAAHYSKKLQLKME